MTITSTIKSQWAKLSESAQAHIRASRPNLLTRWDLYECGERYATITADCAADALEEAAANVDRSNYGVDEERTLYIDVRVHNRVTGEEDECTVTLEPEEPECADGHEHDWRTPYSVLGGLKENPGVWGKGGGVIAREVCAHCGKYQITDTWAQRSDTGEQGLTEVSHEAADDASLEWVAEHAE